MFQIKQSGTRRRCEPAHPQEERRTDSESPSRRAMEGASNLSVSLLAAITAGVVLLGTVNTALGLQCYDCSEQPVQLNPNKTVPLCSDFDKSWRFVVDCPHSTFCRKISVELPLANGKVIRSVKRDCAPQLHSFQKLENRSWVHKNETVTDIYNEGCGKQNTGVATSSEYCYCRSYLCNSSKSSFDSSYSHHSDAMAVIFVFNAMKYLRSLR